MRRTDIRNSLTRTGIAIFLFLLTNCEYKDDKYKVGQVWYYDTRAHEKGSTLTVVAIENNKEFGIIVSVYVEGLKMKAGEYTFNNLEHLPLTKAAMDSSVTWIKGNADELPDYRQNYQAWKDTFKDGKGRVVTVSVKEMVEQFEDNYNADMN